MREPDPVDDVVDQLGEVVGTLPGVAAVLVDLAGGRLDQQQAAVLAGLERGGLHDQRVGRADGGHADGLAAVVLRDQVDERVGEGV